MAKERIPRIKSVSYNALMNFILKISSVIFPLITFPYTARVLLAVGNGKIAFASSFISYFTMFASLGIPIYGIKAVAQVRDDREKLSTVVQELLLINVVCIIISYLVFFATLIYVPRINQESILMMLNSITIILNPLGVEWFYQGIEQYGYITRRNLIFKGISIAMMFLFVHTVDDYIIYGGINVLASAGANIFNIIRIRKYLSFQSLKMCDWKKHIKPVLMLFLLTVTTSIYTSLDASMLGFISGDVQVGYYNAATKTKGILLSIVIALGTVLLPRASYYAKNNFLDEFNKIIKKSIQFTFLAGLSMSVYFVFNSDIIIQFLAGNGYEGAILPMRIITPTILIIGLNNITGMQILVPFNKEKLTTISTIIGALTDVVLNIILIPKMGASGAALATLIAEFVVLSVQVFFIGKSIIQWVDINNCIKSFLAICISFIALLITDRIYFSSLFLKLMISAFIYFGSLSLFLKIFKEKIFVEIMEKIKSFLKK